MCLPPPRDYERNINVVMADNKVPVQQSSKVVADSTMPITLGYVKANGSTTENHHVHLKKTDGLNSPSTSVENERLALFHHFVVLLFYILSPT